MNMWDFLNNVFESIALLLALVFLTPYGWISLMIIFLFMSAGK